MTGILPFLSAWALLGVPGFLVLGATGSRLRLRWGWAPVVTVLMTVVLGALYRLLGIPWELLSALLGYLFLAALVLLIRAVNAHRAPRGRYLAAASKHRERHTLGPPGSKDAAVTTWSRPVAAAVTGTAVAAGALVAASSSTRMGGLSTLNGSFDSFFHLSAIAFIRERGDAFLPTALLDIYGEPTFYPVVVDVLASVLPFDTVTAANALMLALLAALPASVAALVAAVAMPRRQVPALAAVSAAASTLFLSTAAMALVMGLWPIVLAVVCQPLAIASVLLLLDHRRSAPGLREVAGYGAVLLGTALAHPSVLFSVAVVAGLQVLVGGIRRVRHGQRRRGWIQVSAASAAALLFVLASGTVLKGMHLTKPGAEGLGSVLRQILVDSPRIPAVSAQIWPVAVVWILAVIGAICAVRRQEALGSTAAVTVVASIVLGLSTQIDSPLTTALVNPWYGARERIAPLMMCMLVLLMARGILAVTDAGRQRGRALPAALAIGAVAVTVLFALVVPQRMPLLGSLAYTAYGVQLSPYVPAQERSFIERTAAELPADSVVLADPLDGATLYWSVGDVETVFPTMSRPLTRETTLIANYADRAGTPRSLPELCAALRSVGPTHLYRDRSPHAGQEMNPEDSSRWSGVHDIPQSRLTLVEAEGPYALYELEPAC